MKQMVGLVLMLCLSACSREPAVKNADIVTVNEAALTNTLYFSGVVEPMHALVLTSPVDGAVIDMGFQYGDVVKQGEPLFYLSSTKFLSDYKNALLEYIKAKNEFDQSKTQMHESAFLHKNLLISDDDFASKKSAYFSSRLAFMQAKDALSVYLNQMNIKNINLYQLSIADIDKIKQAMQLQDTSNRIILNAPTSGVILSPAKSSSGFGGKLEKGDAVKQGDTLAMIGDMRGLSVKFKVNELTINQIKLGQSVSITGIAFPGMTLSGKVSQVDKQADSDNGSLPSFDIEVAAPLNAEEQQVIHPGMSANIEMNLVEPTRIHIPIQALIESSGQTAVSIVDAKTHTLKQVSVVTGKTTPTEVEILAGLKPGDRLVVPH